MPALPTFQDLFRAARDELLIRSAKISREMVERDGSDANVLIAAACAACDQVVAQLSKLWAGLYLDSAQGSDLDRLVFDRYGLVRKPPSASLGTVQFTTTAPTSQAVTIPSGTRLATSDGVGFVTTEDVIFPNASTGPVSCAVRSVLAGSGQDAKTGQITSISSQITSQPVDLAVSNPVATAGADDAETDESLRDRARLFFTTARRGTLGAIEAAALGVSGVRKATAFEVIDAIGRPARFVQLVVADAFTEQFATYDTVPPRYQTQSQLLSTVVFNSLSDVRAAGIYVQVQVANVVLQPIQLALTFLAGADVNDATLRARAAIVSYVNQLAPGKPFVYDDAQAMLATVSGLAPSGNQVLSPAGSVAVKPLQVLRTSLGLVSAVAAQTNQPITTGTNPDAFSLAGG